ncbi:MAG: tetratricopeptide repeat protein [Alkalispirochaetaceae bacterium]
MSSLRRHSLILALLLLSALGLSAQEARDFLRRGEQALSRSAFDITNDPLFDAIEQFQRALEVNPRYRDALAGLAEAYYLLEEYPTALGYARDARRLGGANRELRNLEAKILLAQGEIAAAREIYQSLLREEPNNLQARLGTAQIALAEGNSAQAARELEQLLRRSPDNRRALLSLTLIYQNRGNREAAERYLREALRFHSDNPRVHLIAGEYEYARGALEEARFHAETALSLSPTFVEARILLAEILLDSGATEAAEAQLRQAAEQAPRSPRVWYTLGWVLEELGESDEALQALQRGRDIDPGEERLTLAIERIASGLPLEDDRRRPIAEEYLERGRELVERNLVSRGEVLFRTGLRLDPFSRELRLALADIYELRGFRARYLQELEVLLELGNEDQFITDRIESYESFLADSVANDWGVDQFTLPRERYTLLVGYLESQETGEWYRNDLLFADHLRDFLLRDERLEVSGESLAVADEAQLLRRARERGDQYALLLNFDDSDRSFRLQGTLYLVRTGELVERVETIRGGNNRVESAVAEGADMVRSSVPQRGSLVRREFSEGLINMGRVSGIEADQELRLVRQGAAQPTAQEPGIIFREADQVGTFLVTRVDDLVAEGTIRTASVIDRVRLGDQFFLLPEEFEPVERSEGFRSPLFENVEALR